MSKDTRKPPRKPAGLARPQMKFKAEEDWEIEADFLAAAKYMSVATKHMNRMGLAYKKLRDLMDNPLPTKDDRYTQQLLDEQRDTAEFELEQAFTFMDQAADVITNLYKFNWQVEADESVRSRRDKSIKTLEGEFGDRVEQMIKTVENTDTRGEIRVLPKEVWARLENPFDDMEGVFRGRVKWCYEFRLDKAAKFWGDMLKKLYDYAIHDPKKDPAPKNPSSPVEVPQLKVLRASPPHDAGMPPILLERGRLHQRDRSSSPNRRTNASGNTARLRTNHLDGPIPAHVSLASDGESDVEDEEAEAPSVQRYSRIPRKASGKLRDELGKIRFSIHILDMDEIWEQMDGNEREVYNVALNASTDLDDHLQMAYGPNPKAMLEDARRIRQSLVPLRHLCGYLGKPFIRRESVEDNGKDRAPVEVAERVTTGPARHWPSHANDPGGRMSQKERDEKIMAVMKSRRHRGLENVTMGDTAINRGPSDPNWSLAAQEQSEQQRNYQWIEHQASLQGKATPVEISKGVRWVDEEGRNLVELHPMEVDGSDYTESVEQDSQSAAYEERNKEWLEFTANSKWARGSKAASSNGIPAQTSTRVRRMPGKVGRKKAPSHKLSRSHRGPATTTSSSDHVQSHFQSSLPSPYSIPGTIPKNPLVNNNAPFGTKNEDGITHLNVPKCPTNVAMPRTRPNNTIRAAVTVINLEEEDDGDNKVAMEERPSIEGPSHNTTPTQAPAAESETTDPKPIKRKQSLSKWVIDSEEDDEDQDEEDKNEDDDDDEGKNGDEDEDERRGLNSVSSEPPPILDALTKPNNTPPARPPTPEPPEIVVTPPRGSDAEGNTPPPLTPANSNGPSGRESPSPSTRRRPTPPAAKPNPTWPFGGAPPRSPFGRRNAISATGGQKPGTALHPPPEPSTPERPMKKPRSDVGSPGGPPSTSRSPSIFGGSPFSRQSGSPFGGPPPRFSPSASAPPPKQPTPDPSKKLGSDTGSPRASPSTCRSSSLFGGSPLPHQTGSPPRGTPPRLLSSAPAPAPKQSTPQPPTTPPRVNKSSPHVPPTTPKRGSPFGGPGESCGSPIRPQRSAPQIPDDAKPPTRRPNSPTTPRRSQPLNAETPPPQTRKRKRKSTQSDESKPNTSNNKPQAPRGTPPRLPRGLSDGFGPSPGPRAGSSFLDPEGISKAVSGQSSKSKVPLPADVQNLLNDLNTAPVPSIKRPEPNPLQPDPPVPPPFTPISNLMDPSGEEWTEHEYATIMNRPNPHSQNRMMLERILTGDERARHEWGRKADRRPIQWGWEWIV